MSSLAGALTPTGSPSKSEPDDVTMDDETEQHEEGMADLFGGEEDDHLQDDDEDAASERLPSQEREHRKALEYEEDDAVPDLPEKLQEANVTFPNIPVPRSTTGEKWILKLPKFFKLDSKAFHPDTYMAEQVGDEQPMTTKLRIEHTLRWRWAKDEVGNDIRQSNSRVIRWSDGSLSLRLGKELFDVTHNVDTAGGVQRQSLGGTQLSQSHPHALPTSHTPGGKAQGLTYLVAQHKISQVLQAEAIVTGTMTLVPTGMQSDVHRMLARSVGEKHTKVARLKMAADPTVDPEREAQEAIKKAKRREPRSRDDRPNRKKARYNDRSLEYDDDDVFGDSDSDDGRHRRSTSKKSKKDDDAKGDYQRDDFLVEDEEEDSDDDRRRHGQEDELDRLDAGAEKAVSRRGGPAKEDGEEMDVESEEEDDEPKVRRGGAGGSRRKRAAYEEDEEEDE